MNGWKPIVLKAAVTMLAAALVAVYGWAIQSDRDITLNTEFRRQGPRFTPEDFSAGIETHRQADHRPLETRLDNIDREVGRTGAVVEQNAHRLDRIDAKLDRLLEP